MKLEKEEEEAYTEDRTWHLEGVGGLEGVDGWGGDHRARQQVEQ